MRLTRSFFIGQILSEILSGSSDHGKTMLSLANPWVVLAAVLALTGAVGGAYVKGRGDGRAVEIAQRVTIEEVAKAVREAAMEAAAGQIAKITKVHTTIRQQAETVIREKLVYRDCVNDASVSGLLDAARANQSPAEPAGGGELPGAGASPTPDVR
jgi:hypothetical protein